MIPHLYLSIEQILNRADDNYNLAPPPASAPLTTSKEIETIKIIFSIVSPFSKTIPKVYQSQGRS